MEKTINNSNNFQAECESLESTFWQRSLSLRWLPLVLRRLKKIRQSVIHGSSVGRINLMVAYNEVLSNGRIFVGVVMMLGVAPVLYWAHLFFDYEVVVKGWYYKNMFFWTFTNREEFFFGIGLTGFFLILPQKSGYRYLLVPIVGMCFSEIIYQSLQISHWTHFYRPMWSRERGWELAVMIVQLVFALYKVINYLVYRHYHLKEGNAARITGMVAAPGVPREKRLEILDSLVEETKNYNARV